MSDQITPVQQFSSEPLPMPPASGQIIEVFPRGQRPPDAPEGLGSGTGGGVGAGEGEGEPLPLPPPDAPPVPYEAYRAQRAQAEAVQRARQRAEQRQRQQLAAAPPDPERTPEQRASERDAYAAERAARIAPAADAAPGEGEARGPREPRRTPAAQSAARTVTRNAAEAVTGVPRGVLGAFASLFEAGDDLADWLAGTTPETHPNTPGRMIGRGFRYLQPGREPETISGQVSEEIAQFVTGFLRGGVTLRRFGVLQGGGRLRQATRAGAAGAIADFFYQEADEANLAAVWQRVGLPANALTEFLATRADDDAAVNRLRNAAAGVVVGAALDGAIAVARAARAGLAARREAGTAAPGAAAPRPEAATLSEASGQPANPARDIMLVGDPNRPLVEVGGARPADVGRRMAEASAATSDAATGVSAYTAATALTRAAEEARDRLVRFDLPVWLARGDEALTEAEQAARAVADGDAARLPDNIAELLLAMRRGRVGPRGEVSLVSYIVKGGGINAQGDGRELFLMLGGGREATRARVGLFNNQRRRFIRDPNGPGGVNVGGQRAEHALEAAIADGYLREGTTLDEFFEAIADEIGGRGTLYGHSEDAAGRALAEAAADLDRLLTEAGLGIRDRDADIARALGFGADAKPQSRDGWEIIEWDEVAPGRRVETAANTAAIREATEPGEVFVNWGRINTGADVQAVIRDMAEAYRGRINDAARRVQTNAATRELADRLNLTVEQLLARRPGEAWNAETITAARDLYTASGERLMEAARAASMPGAGPLEAATFRRMMSLHYAIQAEVLGARREAGRAVQAWAIPATSGARQMRMIEDLLEGSGGVETAQGMARRLAMLADNLPPDEAAREISTFTNRGWGGRSIEAVQQVWINALLSSPATHLANITGNALNIPLTLAERAMQAGIGRATGSADAAIMAEAPAVLYGLLTGFRDGLRLAARTYGDDGAAVAEMIGRQDLPRQGAISSAAWGVDAGSGLGRGLDFLGHQVVSAPGRAMGAEDAFFKSLIFRMELHGQAIRQATREVPLRPDGSHDTAAIGARMAEIMRHPPESVVTAAADQALYRTFNRAAGPIAQRLLALRNSDSPGWNLGMAAVLPFVRTPANLFSYGLERTPLAPMVGQWRAEVAAGGARRDDALARVALGSLILAHTYQMAEQDVVSGYGPRDPRERQAWLRTGAQPYSVRIGDAWVPFNRLDPYGFMLGFAADLRELMDRRDLGEREEVEVSRMIAAGVAMASNALGERSFFRGVASLAEAIDNRQPSAERWAGQTMSSLLVPGIVAAAGQAIDPTQYDRGQGWIAGRLAGLAADPGIPRRNLWGEVMQRPGVETLGAVGAAISPIRPTTQGGRPIDREMQRLAMGVDAVDSNGSVQFGDAVLNLRNISPPALDQLRRWAGNEMPLPAFGGKGLADALDEMVQGRGPYGESFTRASDEGRERAIRQVASLYRRAARERLLADPAFPEVLAVVRQRAAERGEGRGEVPLPGSLPAAMREPGQPPPRRGAAAQPPAVR